MASHAGGGARPSAGAHQPGLAAVIRLADVAPSTGASAASLSLTASDSERGKVVHSGPLVATLREQRHAAVSWHRSGGPWQPAPAADGVTILGDLTPDSEGVLAACWRDPFTLELVTLEEHGASGIRRVTARRAHDPAALREALRMASRDRRAGLRLGRDR